MSVAGAVAVATAIRKPLAIAAAGTAAVGAGSWMALNSRRGDDTVGALTVMLGGIAAVGTSFRIATNPAFLGKGLLRAFAPPMVGLAAVATAVAGASYLTGHGAAMPTSTVADHVKHQMYQSKHGQQIGGGTAPDEARVRAHFESYDTYDKHGAKAGDGQLVWADSKRLTADEARTAGD